MRPWNYSSMIKKLWEILNNLYGVELFKDQPHFYLYNLASISRTLNQKNRLGKPDSRTNESATIIRCCPEIRVYELDTWLAKCQRTLKYILIQKEVE